MQDHEHMNPTDRRARRRVVTLVLTASALTAATAISTHAHAAPYERGSYHDAGTEIVDWCPGIEMQYSFEASGTWIGRVDPRSGTVLYGDSSRGTNTYTNLANGRTFHVAWAGSTRDRTITAINDETLTVLVQGMGSERWIDADGRLAYANPGLVRYEILIDHGGTPADPSDDEFVEFLGVQKGSTGRNDLDGIPFCDVVETLIG